MSVDTKKLRELAEAPLSSTGQVGQAARDFIAAASPRVVIALLDEIEMLRGRPLELRHAEACAEKNDWKATAMRLRDTTIIAEQHLGQRGEDIRRLEQQLAAKDAEIEKLRSTVAAYEKQLGQAGLL